MPSSLRVLPALLLALLLSACTSVPFEYPREASTAIPVSEETRYGTTFANWAQKQPDLSGFVPLIPGMDALSARLVMMENAEASIDAQYFLIKPDQAGELFLGKLLRAAERGVRVRLLVDDIFTTGMDRILALFNAHPNIEVRLFNPASRNSPKAWSYIWNFSRVNRRMHNKAFIVDGSLAIMGGRNIAEEYFELEPQQDFDDLEMLIVGEVVPEIAASFDNFWNSEMSVPMEAFNIKAKDEKLEKWLALMDDIVSGERQSAYANAIDSPFLNRIISGEKKVVPADADLYYDEPEKLLVSRNDDEFRTLESAVERRLQRAEKEVVIITPYLVPRDLKFRYLKQAHDRGVRVIIITNSLSSTNHVAVHSAYAPHRKAMLEAGAELYELKVDEVPSKSRKSLRPERVTLHTKAVIVDREHLFIGSMNFDPRSLELNTEIGLFINSPELAQSYYDLVIRDRPRFTYKVQLSDKGALQWHYNYKDEQRVLTKEPDTGFGRRFKSGFYGLLPIDSQL